LFKIIEGYLIFCVMSIVWSDVVRNVIETAEAPFFKCKSKNIYLNLINQELFLNSRYSPYTCNPEIYKVCV
jgi:hypothetical protein